MMFTDREILEAIAAAIGFLFILWGWQHLDNRKDHSAIRSELRNHNNTMVTLVMKMFKDKQ
jgi:hypothetical protein